MNQCPRSIADRPYRNTHNKRPRDESIHKPKHTDDIVTRRIKIESPIFDGAHDLKLLMIG